MPTKYSRGVIGAKRIVGPSTPGGTATRSARESMREINKKFKQLVANLEAATPEALLFAVQPILDKADIYVPKDTESLRESQYVEAFVRGGQPHVEVGYGHVNASGTGHLSPYQYAAIVHERPDLQHAAPTRYKYLQAAMQENLSKIPRRVAQFLKRVVS